MFAYSLPKMYHIYPPSTLTREAEGVEGCYVVSRNILMSMIGQRLISPFTQPIQELVFQRCFQSVFEN
jgi:hypothetical protein